MEVSRDQIAYVAGIFDGEGCVSFIKKERTYFIRIHITNTNRELLDHIQSLFGGSIFKCYRGNEKYKDRYDWVLGWTKAVEFLEIIYPWLIVKTDAADVAFAWQAIRPGRGLKTKEHKEQLDKSYALLKAQIGWINRKGPRRKDDFDPIAKVIEQNNLDAIVDDEVASMGDRSWNGLEDMARVIRCHS